MNGKIMGRISTLMSFSALMMGMIFFYLYSPFIRKLEPVPYSVNLPIALDGPMKVNEKLDQAERIFENQIRWPESMSVHEGNIYTGISDGRIVRITDKGLEDVCRIGVECEGTHKENVCGRPLGMRFSQSGLLYVVDAYHGLFSVDVKTGNKNCLLEASRLVEGEPLTFMNSIALDEEQQVIYITQSSSKWNISVVLVSIVEHELSGRLLKYDLKKNSVSVLKKGLSFPNGVLISNDKKSVLVAEGNEHSIWRYYIKGPEKGQFKKLPIVLPGEVDNLSYSKSGNYWVAVANARTAATPTLYDRSSHYPKLRMAFLMLYHTLALPAGSFLQLIPSAKVQEFGFELATLRVAADILKQHSVIVEFNDEGKVVQSLHSPSGKVCCISEVLEHNGYLYLGSWRNNYLLRLKLL